MFLRKHYRELRKKETVKELYHSVNLEFNYLIAMDEDDKDIDVGKNDHHFGFLTCVCWWHSPFSLYEEGPSVFFLKCPSCLGLC